MLSIDRISSFWLINLDGFFCGGGGGLISKQNKKRKSEFIECNTYYISISECLDFNVKVIVSIRVYYYDIGSTLFYI